MSGMAEILDENTRLRALSDAQAAELEAQGSLLSELQEKLAAMQSSHELLTKHLEFLDKKRQLAAAERFIADERQVRLFDGTEVSLPPRDPQVEADDAERAQATDRRKTAKHPRKGRRVVADLPFPKIVVRAPMTASACDACGHERETVEPKVTHRIAWQPGRYVVHEVQQEQCACPRCPNAEVWTVPQPYLLPDSMCDDGLLVRVLVDKFGDHLPLNRQAKRMGREGLAIGSNVLSGWVCRAFRQVRSLVAALQAQVCSSALLQTDDSGFPVQDGTDGKLANGRLWVVTDQRQAFFSFSRTKEGEHPAELLGRLGVAGKLVADGGSEYNQVVTRLGLQRAGCWSHMRRYFFDAAIQHDEANLALAAIHDLFMIERDLVGLPAGQRLEARAARSRPLVDGLYDWIKAMSRIERPKSNLGGALGYALNQESRMRLFLDDAAVPIHNNLSELLLRQPIVGRKNWLFSRSEGGAEAAAGWFSLIASCMLQGTDPARYLYDVFRRLPDHPAKWVHELTPLNWRLAVDAGDIVPMSPGQLA
jgi:transposase